MENSTKEYGAKTAFLILASTAIILATSAYSFGLLTNQNTVNTSGIIADVSIGVYSNYSCTHNLTTIDWGSCYPGDQKTFTAYVKNLGSSDATLAIEALNWVPSSAPTYLTLVSDYASQTLAPGQVRSVTFTLEVSSTITGITSFSFDIVITSTG